MSNEAFWIAAQTDVVPIAWGDPGTGKTRSIEAFAKALNRHCVSISLSQHEPTDIGGYPKPQEKFVEFLKPKFIFDCAKQPSLLFLDELTTCSPSTQASALRLLTHAKEDLGGDVLIVAAANPPGCAANGYQLEPPVINRLYHHQWKNDMNEWVEKALDGFPEESASKYPILRNNWKKHIPHATALITSFLRSIPYEAQRMPKDNKQDEWGPSAAWPSYRSWTNAFTLLAAAMSLGMDGDKNDHPVCVELIHGCVGQGAAKFLEWKRSLGFISWEQTKDLMKKGKFTRKHMPETSDKAMAYLATMCAAATQPDELSQTSLDLAWQLMVHGVNMGHKDIVVAIKNMLVKHNQEMKHPYPADALKMLSAIFDRVIKHG